MSISPTARPGWNPTKVIKRKKGKTVPVKTMNSSSGGGQAV